MDFFATKNYNRFSGHFFCLSRCLSNSLRLHANLLPLQRSDIYSLLSHSCPKFIGSVSLPMRWVCVWVGACGQERCMTSPHVLKPFGLSDLQDATAHQPCCSKCRPSTLKRLLGNCAVSHARYAAKRNKTRPGKHRRRAVKLHAREAALNSSQKKKSSTN